jgi:hypothetical protein
VLDNTKRETKIEEFVREIHPANVTILEETFGEICPKAFNRWFADVYTVYVKTAAIEKNRPSPQTASCIENSCVISSSEIIQIRPHERVHFVLDNIIERLC